MRDDRGRDRLVVREEIALRDPVVRKEDAVGARQLDLGARHDAEKRTQRRRQSVALPDVTHDLRAQARGRPRRIRRQVEACRVIGDLGRPAMRVHVAQRHVAGSARGGAHASQRVPARSARARSPGPVPRTDLSRRRWRFSSICAATGARLRSVGVFGCSAMGSPLRSFSKRACRSSGSCNPGDHGTPLRQSPYLRRPRALTSRAGELRRRALRAGTACAGRARPRRRRTRRRRPSSAARAGRDRPAAAVGRPRHR